MSSNPVAGLRPGRTILTLLLFALAAIPAWAGDGVWTPVGPPGTSPVIQELVLDPLSPSTLYLLDRWENASGLWKSTDGGNRWISINAGLQTSLTLSLVVDPFAPGTLYLLLDQSVLKSTDGGRTWTEVFQNDPFDGLDFERIVADPAVPGRLWSFYSHDGEMYRSDDGGATWIVLGSVEGGPVGDLAFDPLDSDVVYFSNQVGLWKSTDRGVHWTELGRFDGEGFDWIEIAPSRPATLYAQPTLGGSNPFSSCARSDNGGLTWTLLSFPEAETYCHSLVVDPQDHRRIWVLAMDLLGASRLYGSQNGGATWTEIGSLPALSGIDAPPLVRNPETGTFYLAGLEGVFRSEDDGATWRNGNQGFTQRIVTDLLAVRLGNRTPLLGSFWRKPAMRSRNRGRFWTELPMSFVSALAADPRSPGRILAAGKDENLKAGLYESRNAGATWKLLGFTPRGDAATSIAFPPDRPNAIAIGTSNNGIFQSLDGGRTWKQARAGLPFPPPCDSTVCDPVETLDLSFDPENPRVALAVFFGRIVRSENGGFRWRLSERGITGEPSFIVALERDPRDPQVLWAAGRDRLFKTVDGGVSWFEVDTGFPHIPESGAALFTDLEIDPRDGTLYAATLNLGVLRSRNGGETWEPINAGLPLLKVLVLEVDPGTPGGLFAGTAGAGIWAGRF